MKNKFFYALQEAENKCASTEDLTQLLGRGRAKKGMFEGDLDEGELEIGQVAALIKDIQPASSIITEIVAEYQQSIKKLINTHW